MSWARWGRATASGEDYTHSAPARAQAQCQTYHRGNTRLCKGIYPRLARPHLSWRESPSLQRENILHKNLLELIQYIFIHWHRVWSPTQFTIVLLHTNQSFFINSDTSSFQWSFSLTSGCLAPCQGRAMMVMTFSPLGIHGGGDCESQAEIMWPAETQTAAEASSLPSFMFILAPRRVILITAKSQHGNRQKGAGN